MCFRWSVQLVVLISACAGVLCRLQETDQFDELIDQTPSCRYSGVYIVCSYLEAGDVDLLRQYLQNVTEISPRFGVELDYCDGPSLPVDIFTGYHVQYLNLNHCRFTSMPYDLLSNIDYFLTYLFVDGNNFTSVEVPAPAQDLPFAVFLTHLLMELNNVQQLDSNFLQQYTSLLNLYLGDNDLESIDLELVGLETLQFVYYDNNEITSIASGAFQDLKNLEYLDLSDNNLSTLQEDAFLGLETSPILFVELYGNPWNCTCDLQWLKDWLNSRNLTESSGAECVYPTEGNFNNIDFC